MLRGSSPLPSPEQLAAYPPEGRELIFRMAQATQAHLHRIELERLELRREKLRARAIDRAAQRRQIARGQYLGFGPPASELSEGTALYPTAALSRTAAA